jgi:hypothetical protein
MIPAVIVATESATKSHEQGKNLKIKIKMYLTFEDFSYTKQKLRISFYV